jgi:hypothetical protein
MWSVYSLSELSLMILSLYDIKLIKSTISVINILILGINEIDKLTKWAERARKGSESRLSRLGNGPRPSESRLSRLGNGLRPIVRNRLSRRNSRANRRQSELLSLVVKGLRSVTLGRPILRSLTVNHSHNTSYKSLGRDISLLPVKIGKRTFFYCFGH